ncbi:MAG: hypothetical protein MUO30_09585 [Anaerolineales bacterium]|nr:hypothetical protein [Anaerolineales bacterium]
MRKRLLCALQFGERSPDSAQGGIRLRVGCVTQGQHSRLVQADLTVNGTNFVNGST